MQFRSGRGPCVDANRTEGPAYVASADLRIDHRWPEFAAAATDHGFRAIICTALLPGPGSAWPGPGDHRAADRRHRTELHHRNHRVGSRAAQRAVASPGCRTRVRAPQGAR